MKNLLMAIYRGWPHRGSRVVFALMIMGLLMIGFQNCTLNNSRRAHSDSMLSPEAASVNAAKMDIDTSARAGSFLFMEAGISCPENSRSSTSPYCYMTNPSAAASVVESFRQIGVHYFLLPPEFEGAFPGERVANPNLAQLRTLGGAVKNAGLQFFTSEVWHWGYSIDSATRRFHCPTYKATWIDPVLKPLKKELGDAFAGFHFRDEPGGIAQSMDGENLAALKSCLFQEPEFAGMKVFMNIFPLVANTMALSREMKSSNASIGLRESSEFGVDCAANTVVNSSFFDSVRAEYMAYGNHLAEKVKPDFLGFDYYPFTQLLDSCLILRDLALAENVFYIQALAAHHKLIPVSYLQNVLTNNTPRMASFNDLRWFSAVHMAFGIFNFANFLSHSDPQGAKAIGLLDEHNSGTGLFLEQLNESTARAAILSALSGGVYRGYVGSFLGTQKGEFIASIKSDEVLAGEFSDPSRPDSVSLLLVRRYPDRALALTQVIMDKWYDRVDRFDLHTGTWVNLSGSANSATVALDALPAQVIRFSMNSGKVATARAVTKTASAPSSKNFFQEISSPLASAYWTAKFGSSYAAYDSFAPQTPAPSPTTSPTVDSCSGPTAAVCEHGDFVRRSSCGEEIERWKNAPEPYCVCSGPTSVSCEGQDYVRRDSCGREMERWKNAPEPYCRSAP